LDTHPAFPIGSSAASEVERSEPADFCDNFGNEMFEKAIRRSRGFQPLHFDLEREAQMGGFVLGQPAHLSLRVAVIAESPKNRYHPLQVQHTSAVEDPQAADHRDVMK
jgi:hypothetical protein